jgi:hypothetical protein
VRIVDHPAETEHLIRRESLITNRVKKSRRPCPYCGLRRSYGRSRRPRFGCDGGIRNGKKPLRGVAARVCALMVGRVGALMVESEALTGGVAARVCALMVESEAVTGGVAARAQICSWRLTVHPIKYILYIY